MKKSRKDEFGREKHGDTCMCRRCRSREEARLRDSIRTQLRDLNLKDLINGYGLDDDTEEYDV